MEGHEADRSAGSSTESGAGAAAGNVLADGRRLACRVCRGPVAAASFARCYQCDLHLRQAGGMLADAVVPIGYAVKGGELATDLWRYKAGDDAAAERLRDALRGFLRDHGDRVWQAAGMTAPPGMVAVVPSGQGRAGAHPLARIVASVVHLPMAGVSPTPWAVARGREMDLGWLQVTGPVGGQNVLVVDDTWVSGGSAQSVAVALKCAGAARVAVVVLGRHLDPADAKTRAMLSKANAALTPERAGRGGSRA